MATRQPRDLSPGAFGGESGDLHRSHTAQVVRGWVQRLMGTKADAQNDTQWERPFQGQFPGGGFRQRVGVTCRNSTADSERPLEMGHAVV